MVAFRINWLAPSVTEQLIQNQLREWRSLSPGCFPEAAMCCVTQKETRARRSGVEKTSLSGENRYWHCLVTRYLPECQEIDKVHAAPEPSFCNHLAFLSFP